jgi:NTE family protein
VTDFDRHTEIFDASYLWAREAIAALGGEGRPLRPFSTPAIRLKRSRDLAVPRVAVSG